MRLTIQHEGRERVIEVTDTDVREIRDPGSAAAPLTDPGDLSWPRRFTYSVVEDGRHVGKTLVVDSPFDLDGYKEIFGKRFRISARQAIEMGVSKADNPDPAQVQDARETCLMLWIQEHSEHVSTNA